MPDQRERGLVAGRRESPAEPDSCPVLEPELASMRRGWPVRKRSTRAPRSCLGTCAFFSGASLLVLTLVIGCMLVVSTLSLTKFLRDPLGNFLAVFGFEQDSEPQEVDSRTIVLGIQRLALLQTASGDVLITKTVVDTGAAPDAEITVSYVGHVNAGIDLSLITDADVVVEADGAVTITLPPAQLTGCYLGKPEIQQRECVDIPLVQDCGAIVQRLQDRAYDRALEELRETALALDLLGVANQQAEAQVFEQLRKLGINQVSFRRAEITLSPDPSCSAATP